MSLTEIARYGLTPEGRTFLASRKSKPCPLCRLVQIAAKIERRTERKFVGAQKRYR